MDTGNGGGCVGLVIVSHSASIAAGVADLVGQVAGPDVAIVTAAGGPDGTLGTDGGLVLEVLRSAGDGAGAVVLVDLGSSVLAVRAALNELGDGAARVAVADAPLVEGAVAAGVAASTGASLRDVVSAAEEARHARKL
jgi:dihydroxyacetone kinase phosphotransfer subunit